MRCDITLDLTVGQRMKIARARFGLAWVAFVAGVGVAAYLFPYFRLHSVWWRAIPSAIAIVTLTWLVFRVRAFRLLGLSMSMGAFARSVMLFVAAFVGARFLVQVAIADSGLAPGSRLAATGYVHQFFQVLNDEMVLRAGLLTFALHLLPRAWFVAVTTAAGFSLGHYAAYRLNGDVVDVDALLTIFAFGLTSNLLFLRYGHIGYCVALHYAWNLRRFEHAYVRSGVTVPEGTSFNFIEGSPTVMLAGLALLVAVALIGAAGKPVSGVFAPKPGKDDDADNQEHD